MSLSKIRLGMVTRSSSKPAGVLGGVDGAHLMRANLLTVRCSLMGTVFTKVVKDRPLPSVKLMTLVLGSSACAVTFTSGTCRQNFQVSIMSRKHRGQ